MNKLLEEAKALNIPRRNLMKKDQLEQAIKDTVGRYKELVFGSDAIYSFIYFFYLHFIYSWQSLIIHCNR